MNHLIISDADTVIDAMAMIDKNAKGIVFVCRSNVLIATLTDGDIRRHILAGKSLNSPAIEAANTNCYYLNAEDASDEIAYNICLEKSLSVIPIVDYNKHLVSVYFKNSTQNAPKAYLEVPVVIMAGGKGTRLFPYTKVLPKPLIPIGDMTITEHIMNEFSGYGCNDFTMIVNHKKNMIKAYFSDDSTKYNINFVDEDKPMGTGGGLSLLRGFLRQTFFLTNCDILIFEDYAEILKYHKIHKNLLTIVCSTKNIEIPYGVVKIKEYGQITSMQEKPKLSFLTNTGFYLIEPEFLNLIPENTFIHITDVIQNCIDVGSRVGMFPIGEDRWFDMGQLDEMERMQNKIRDMRV